MPAELLPVQRSSPGCTATGDEVEGRKDLASQHLAGDVKVLGDSKQSPFACMYCI